MIDLMNKPISNMADENSQHIENHVIHIKFAQACDQLGGFDKEDKEQAKQKGPKKTTMLFKDQGHQIAQGDKANDITHKV